MSFARLARTGLIAACVSIVAVPAPAGQSSPAGGPGASPASSSESAAAAPALSAGAAARSGPAFDVKAATDAYLAKVPPAEKARSDAYFEGGYWLLLIDCLYGLAVVGLLLKTGWSARMRDLAERVTRRKPLQTWAYWIQFIVVTAVVSFPLTVYQGYIREHQYGLANQTFGPWLGDQVKGLLVALVFGGPFMIAIFGVIRRAPRRWPVLGALVTLLFLMFGQLIAPVYVAPLFNTYKKLEDPQVVGPILSLARANGIDVSDVYQVDASRQSKRISANVSGFLGTQRITLNDNLLRRCSPQEIEAVMGHEMGHYVLNHVYKGVMYDAIITTIGFAFLAWGLGWALGRWGGAWGVRGVGDVAVLPLAVALLSIFSFLLTPINNTAIRTQEYEADIFGLNAVRQPDAEAEVDLKLGEYRKLDPGPVEEWIFFDHPSGRTRITAAMRWKAENVR